jgi:RND family efflux transporter MFP subunit
MIKNKIIVLGIAMSLFACTDKNSTSESEMRFPVTKAIYIDTNTNVDYVAEISAVQNVEIRAKAKGYLEKIHVDEGSNVSAGQLLFSINNREYSESLAKNRALLKIAQAEAKNAELELKNTKALLEKDVISEIEVEFAKNKLQIARAKVEEADAEEAHAKQMLSYTEIRAPFAGIINRLPQKTGSLMDEGSLLTTLTQNEEVFAYFDVSEKEYLDFMSKLTSKEKRDREVELILANGVKHKAIGTIETMDGEIDQETGNLAFRARFNNPDKLLKHGASGKIRIQKDFKNALVIPQKATFEIQDRVFVYVVGKDNVLKTRQIQIQSRIPNLYILSKGLTTDERIVYEGIQSASDGLKIKPKTIKMKKIIQDLSKF